MLRKQRSARKFTTRIKPTLSIAYLSKWYRVFNNLSAGAGILVVGIVVLLLLYQGMFKSTHVNTYFQSKWTPHTKTCRLGGAGFVAQSCDPTDVAVAGEVPWAAVGAQLATDLRIGAAATPAFVTTCFLSGGHEDSATLRWASFIFVVGESAFPSCSPVGRQEILGMSALDTMGDEKHPDGVFLLSTFSDTAAPIAPLQIRSTVGTVTTATTSTIKTIVNVDGTREPTSWDQANYITSLNSLNRLYLMQVWVVAHFPDISAAAPTLVGYSVGKTTGYMTTLGWENSHEVDNYKMLFIYQVAICGIALALLSNDGVITMEGLSGLLKNKPVLTYDILGSLERRRLVLLALIGTFLFSPLYIDVIRYTYAINGHHYWSFSLLMVALMMGMSWMMLLTCVQSLPVPAALRHRPLAYSAPVFTYLNGFCFICYEYMQGRGPTEAAKFWSYASPTLTLRIDGNNYTAGAYSLDGTTPMIYILMPDILVCLIASWAASVLAHKLFHGHFTLDTSWTGQNDFVNQLSTPHWVTSLDLDRRNTISIGSKLYCKPSLMVLLGYCTIHDDRRFKLPGDTHLDFSSRESSCVDTSEYTSSTAGSSNRSAPAPANKGGKIVVQPTARASVKASTPSHHHEAIHYMVLSIYMLVPSIVTRARLWYQPFVFGEIHQNKFTRSKSTTRVEKDKEYVYSRGDCCA